MISDDGPTPVLLMDACVLIDFIKADVAVLQLIANHVGPVHVISSVIDEVKDLGGEALVELGVTIIEPELADAFAAAGSTGPISFQDRLCLLTAKRHGHVCVTNDISLRKQCEKENVRISWGLELLTTLHRRGGIPSSDAIDIAELIHKNNPRHITASIIERFVAIIKQQRR